MNLFSTKKNFFPLGYWRWNLFNCQIAFYLWQVLSDRFRWMVKKSILVWLSGVPLSSYWCFTRFIVYGQMLADKLNDRISSWNFVRERVYRWLKYPKNFNQNECILLEIINFQKTTVSYKKLKFTVENSRFLKIDYLKKDAFALIEFFWIF